MKPPSPDASALFGAARAAIEPTADDRARNRLALAAKLAGATPDVASEPEAASAQPNASAPNAAPGVTALSKVILGAFVLGALGAGAAWRAAATPSEAPTPSARATSVAPVASASSRTIEAHAVAPTPRPVVTPPPPPEAPKPAKHAAARDTTSSLDAEVALLESTTRALRAHDTARALTTLDTYDARFPRGALREEASAARIVTLCEAGRDAEARALADAFVERSPRSPLTSRVRASCAGANRR